jgi:hypothetical protein
MNRRLAGRIGPTALRPDRRGLQLPVGEVSDRLGGARRPRQSQQPDEQRQHSFSLALPRSPQTSAACSRLDGRLAPQAMRTLAPTRRLPLATQDVRTRYLVCHPQLVDLVHDLFGAALAAVLDERGGEPCS